MYNPTTRLLAILELLQSRGAMSGHDLAQALEVEERTIRRYILMLRDIGIPIEGERGRYGGYSLRPGFRLPPMMFNAEEITAVMMGLMLMQALGATAQTATASAAAKIERVLPEDLRHRSEALQQSLILDDIQFGARKVSNEKIMAISLAAHESKCLKISYRSADGQLSQRVIEPYGLVWHARTCYLAAYCHLRCDRRVFRLDRVQSVSRSEQSFTRPTDFDPREFVLNSLAQLPGTIAFEVLIHAPLQTVQECIPGSMAILETTGDSTLMRCYSDDPHWMARYLASFELPFTVIESDALRSALYDLANNLRNAAHQQADEC